MFLFVAFRNFLFLLVVCVPVMHKLLLLLYGTANTDGFYTAQNEYYMPFKIVYASLKLEHSSHFAGDSVKEIVYRSEYIGKNIVVSFFRICSRRGKQPIVSSCSKDRKRRKADLENREDPRRRCKRKLFSRVSQVCDRGMQR